jgi:biotin-dependent carboxylase-like uncharacterized protein
VSNHLEAVRGGALTTIQDAGRISLAHLAVPRSGALDVPAMRLANRLVGNPETAAVLETTVDGTAVRVAERCHIAVTGAPAEVRVGGRQVGWGVPVPVRAGEVVDIGLARHGVRSYLAVAGGIAVEPVMGSRSTDLLSGLGPPVVKAGAVLPVGPDRPAPVAIDFAPYPTPARYLELRCYLGPRNDWLADPTLSVLHTATWTVTEKSNRIGLRLSGPPLRWGTDEELLSEGVVHGSVQVPPDGQPVLFLSDHPITGGYPVVAVVPAPDIWLCGQAVPGTVIRLRPQRINLPSIHCGH